MSYLQGRWGVLSAAPQSEEQSNMNHTSRPSIHFVSYSTLLIVLSRCFGLLVILALYVRDDIFCAHILFAAQPRQDQI